MQVAPRSTKKRVDLANPYSRHVRLHGKAAWSSLEFSTLVLGQTVVLSENDRPFVRQLKGFFQDVKRANNSTKAHANQSHLVLE